MSTYNACSSSVTLNIYGDMIEQGRKELLEASEESDGWKLCKSNNAKSKNVVIHKKKRQVDSIVKVRGKGIIEAAPDEILNIIRGFGHAKEIDPMFQEGKVLEKLDNDHHILMSRYRIKTSVVKQREIVYLESVLSSANGMKLLLRFSIPRDDVTHMKIPIRGNCIRGHMLYSGWVVKPIGSNSSEKFKIFSEVTYLYQVDPKGLLPSFITNAFSGDEALCIDRVRSLVKAQKASKTDSQYDVSVAKLSSAQHEVDGREPLDEVDSENISPLHESDGMAKNDESDGMAEVDDSVNSRVEAS